MRVPANLMDSTALHTCLLQRYLVHSGCALSLSLSPAHVPCCSLVDQVTSCLSLYQPFHCRLALASHQGDHSFSALQTSSQCKLSELGSQATNHMPVSFPSLPLLTLPCCHRSTSTSCRPAPTRRPSAARLCCAWTLWTTSSLSTPRSGTTRLAMVRWKLLASLFACMARWFSMSPFSDSTLMQHCKHSAIV